MLFLYKPASTILTFKQQGQSVNKRNMAQHLQFFLVSADYTKENVSLSDDDRLACRTLEFWKGAPGAYPPPL